MEASDEYEARLDAADEGFGDLVRRVKMKESDKEDKADEAESPPIEGGVAAKWRTVKILPARVVRVSSL